VKHLLVVAHPSEDSFTIALTRAYAAELKELGHSQRQAQDDIRAADTITVIYPLWWLSMPAIMKGLSTASSRAVLPMKPTTAIVHGLLSGKKSVLITISGAPMSLLAKCGDWNAVEVLQDTHIFRSAEFELLEHLHFDEVAPHLSDAIAGQHMARIRSCARQYFTAG
jgi:NAD(P)H dehydrogenase (quinone)